MAHELTPVHKRDKFREFFGLRPRTHQPAESSVNLAATSSLNTSLPPSQSEGKPQPTVPNLHAPSIQSGKVFAKGESSKRDMAILSTAYILQESPELKKLIQLIVVIRDKDSEGQLTAILETCARFSVQLASATDAHRAEATQAITAFTETVAKIRTIKPDGDVTSLDALTSMVNEDINKIKPSFIGNGNIGNTQGLSKVLDITIGPTIGILSVVKDASSLIPVPWVQPLIGTVVGMLQAVSQTLSNYNEMKQIAATAGEFVVSCAVICAESTAGPFLESSLKKFYKTLQSIAEECDKFSQLNLFSRFLQQSGQMGDLQAIRKRLDEAIQLFQTENSISIKLDTEELNRKIDFASLNDLPSHPHYTRNEYLESSRDDVLQDISDWIANGPESVLWVHGGAGLGKSTAAQELVHLLKSEDRLAGGVFLNNLATEAPERVIQMISRQLGGMHPQAIADIAEAARTLDGPHDKLGDYFTAYIFNPIHALQYPYQLVCVVDGLDEWRSYQSFLAELVHIPSPSLVKFVLTSRFNFSIERAVDKMLSRKYPLPLASQTVIERYFNHHFFSGDIDWRGRTPDKEEIHRLAARANGLLIWAATARLVVMNPFDSRYPHAILDQILASAENVVGQKDGELEHLYRSALSTLFPSDVRAMLRKFLAATIVLQEALPVRNFARLAGIPEPATEEIHRRLAALQTQSDPKTNLVTPALQRFHASFVDFITTESNDKTFQAISATEAHYMLGKRCLEIVFVELLPSFRGRTCSYSELRGVELYAVKFWPLHFSSGTPRQPMAPPGGKFGLDIISEEAMHRWGALYLPCVAPRLQDGHDLHLDSIPRSVLPYALGIAIFGMEDVATLSYSIQCLKIATQLHPLDPERWKALGVAYRTLYEQSHFNGDLDEEITAFRHGLETAPHHDRSTALSFLAVALQDRFGQQGASDDLDEAISLNRECLPLRPVPHEGRPSTLNNLAAVLRTRFEQQNTSDDLDEAISLAREALLLLPTHPDRHGLLNNLAIALETRFAQRGASVDLDEAISLHKEALLLLPAPHPDRYRLLTNLASVLETRYEQQGNPNDLDEVISLNRECLLLLPAPHPDRSSLLNNLATALGDRFERKGTSSDLDEAISLHREVLLLFQAPHPNRSSSLNNLCYTLQTRSKQKGTSNDIDEAIALGREALLLLPEPHPDRSRSLNILAAALRTRFDQQGTSDDLDEAISMGQEALHLLPPPNPERPSSLNGLATALEARFQEQGASSDLNVAISLLREAVLLCPAPHPLYSRRLRNFAIALAYRFVCTLQLNYLGELFSTYKRLLDCPAEDPNRSWCLEQMQSMPEELQENFAEIADLFDIGVGTEQMDD